MPVALTSLSHGAGCGCKLPAAAVHELVGRLPVTARDDVLVGFGTADDAGVVRVRDDLALVQTVDFFTPIVDDPYDFGRIAATNALSDVWAMGGEPLSALSLVAWPLERLGTEALEAVLRGGHDAVFAAGAARAAGAHALTDVTGFGLLGHLHELAAASGCAAEVEAAALPAIDGVLDLLARDDERAIAGGTRRNRAYAEGFASFAAGVDEA